MDEGDCPSYLIESGCEKINKNDFLNINFTNKKIFKM
jgi:hypothetical protein